LGAYASSVPGNREAAIGRLRGPAIAIIVICVLGVLYQLVMLALNILGVGISSLAPPGGSDQFINMMSGGVGIILGLAQIVLNAFGIFAALKMMKAESYAMAWIATIIVALPCSFCCCFGIPIAIWSIIVLIDDQVKAAFPQ
jgi:hypothetical protein